MRKTKLLLVAFWAMFGLSVSAQTWTTPQIKSADPVNGSKYKVLNVGSGKYLAMGKAWFSWATTAILSDNGIDFTMTADGSNWKFIRTGVQGVFTSGNGIAGDAMHVDNTANTYGITKMPNGYYHIHDAGGNGESTCWGYKSDFHAAGVVAHADATAEGWMCDWAFLDDNSFKLFDAQYQLYNALNQAKNESVNTDAAVAVYNNSSATVEELIAACATLKNDIFENRINGASPDNPVDITDLVVVNPSFETGNTDGWSYEASNDHGAKENSNATYTINNADGKYVFNIWSSGNAISQKIDNLPNGSYKLKVLIATDGGQKVQINANDASLQIDAVDKGTGVDGEVSFSVLDGTATIGAEGVNKYWYKVDNFRLFYMGALTDFTAFQEALDQAVADAEAINQSDKMSATALSGLQGAISTYKGQTYSSEEDYNSAIQAVKTATSNAKISIASYAIIASGTVPTDKLDGWTCTNTQTFHINTWSVEGNPGNDPSGMTTPFIENWRGAGDNAGLGEGVFSYTLEGLEPGESYYASGLIRSYNERNSDAPNGPDFFVNESVSNLSEAGITFTYKGMSGIYATLGAMATVGEDGKLTIGAKIASDANYNWVAFKNVAIQTFEDALAAAVRKAEAMYPSLPEAVKNALQEVVDDNKNGSDESAIAAINAAMTSASAAASAYAGYTTALNNAKALTTDNVGTDAFQIPADAASTLSTAITTAEEADLSNETSIKEATNQLNEAITAYQSAEINQPAEGQLFNVILTFADYEFDNKAITYLANAREDGGLYNIQYKEAANQNLAQAFTFTHVEGNNYKLSQIDADGSVRYLSTGVPYGGNASQIRTTTSESDALVVTVIPTATEGVWNLRNTEAEQYIGSQDAGVYTVNSHIDFKLVETSKASIAVNTSDAGWGTIIAPFAVSTIPSGVKVYSCDAVDGNQLTLTEVTALEANKPYIIEGSWNETLTGDAQGTELTYTDGLLTGVYAEQKAKVDTYVMQNNTDGVGFYKVASDKEPTIEANHAYLTVNSSARAFLFDDATAIKAIEALANGEAEIFNAAGARVQGLQKGVNIIKTGNKTMKVMVK